jgi:HEAT repeat protein
MGRERLGDTMEEVYDHLLDRFRGRHAREPKSPEWQGLEAELEAHGIDTTDLGIFSSVAATTFDYESAAPLLVEWLPRMRDPVEKEVIARSLTGTKTASAAAARALLAEFRSAPMDDEGDASRKWTYGSALATLADAEIADDLVELITDPRHGRAREMLCDALKRTKDPRAPDVLIELIDDDDVAGHAILALRRYGPKSSLPHLRRARSKLAAVLERPTASVFARRQAHKALERLRDVPT